MQNSEELTARIAKLSVQAQAIVERLVVRLESMPANREMSLDRIIDEFENEHPELLRLLAQ